MPTDRIRIIAWGVALAIFAAFFAVNRGQRPPERTAEREPPSAPRSLAAPVAVAPLATIRAPRMAGAIEPIPFTENNFGAPPAPQLTLQETPEPTPQGHVIREPGVPTHSQAIREPSRNDLPQQDLVISPAAESGLHNSLEMLLTEPRREESQLAPPVANDLSSEPELLGPTQVAPLPLGPDHPAMRPVNDLARKHVERGFSLGDRGALYAARTEFTQALRTVAQAVDAQAGLGPQDPASCSQALVLGLQALTEANDFLPPGGRLDGEIDLAALVAAHRTPICRENKPKSQLAAMQLYFDYARDQLTRAAASNVVASQALTGLGKSYTTGKEASTDRLSGAKAMVFHQAAVASDGRNHLASNELGVLLASYGQWREAKQAFTQSLRVMPDPATWQNLAAIHQQLGERELAQLALQERQLLTANRLPNALSGLDGSATVRWVEPQAFGGPPEDAPQLLVQPSVAPPAAENRPPAVVAGKSDPWSWLPWR
jgi:tetratricopeptide (TPR) repeat protein